MRTIKVKEIIDKQGLDVNEVAQQLFPGIKYPRLALNRVMSGKAVLDENQISKFSLLSGIPLADLFSGENWNAKSKKGLHVFTNGEFRAELNTETWVTKVFHNESLFHESIIHSGATPISEYLSEIDLIIVKFKNNDTSRD